MTDQDEITLTTLRAIEGATRAIIKLIPEDKRNDFAVNWACTDCWAEQVISIDNGDELDIRYRVWIYKASPNDASFCQYVSNHLKAHFSELDINVRTEW